MYWRYPQEWMQKWKNDLYLTEDDFIHQTILKLEIELGSTAGFCAIQENEDVYEITHLWIRPEYIGKGYGKYLLNECLQRVVLNGKPIIVEADPNAESFYSNQGFVTYEQRQSYPEGRCLPLMRRVSNTANPKN